MAFRTCVLMALAMRVVDGKAPMLDGRVIGGEAVDIGQYPYQASLQHNGAHICGGAVIATKFVLTAAHCTDEVSIGELSVRVGSAHHAHGGVLVRIERAHQHDGYDADTMRNDICVLETSDVIEFSATVQPVALSEADPATGAEVVVSGWGRTAHGNPTQLNAAYVQVVDWSVCAKNYEEINAVAVEMFCAGAPEGGRDACQGDSGGPLVGAGVLVGVVSWGYGCARPQYPGVYTSVARMRDWIRRFVDV